jgi:two-component system OmpR family response regulator/two-component system copper resistance phosphate regulon response regulator CusR
MVSAAVMDILLVEDDQVLGSVVRKGLESAGHRCTWVTDGIKGSQEAESQQYDAVVLDLLLPQRHGMEVLYAMRSKGNLTPVIVLTALGSVDNRVAGLNAGADDYLAKPFEFPELLARLAAVTRRTKERPSSQLKVGPVTLDLSNRRVTRADQEVVLTPTEFSLLEYLMRYNGQVVTRKMLCEHLWDTDWEGVTNVVEVHINRLRGKIEKGFDQPLIHTVRGRGYVFRTS